MGCIRKNLSEHNCAVGSKQQFKKICVYRPGHQPAKIDSYGINKPDVKGIVCLVMQYIQEAVYGKLEI